MAMLCSRRVSASNASATPPCCSRVDNAPASDVTSPEGDAAMLASTPATRASSRPRTCSRRGPVRVSVTSPAAHANRAPRENDRYRPMPRGAAAAALGMGLYLSFSRGALFACAAGLVTLIVAAPRREQVRGLLLALVAGVLASIAAS